MSVIQRYITCPVTRDLDGDILPLNRDVLFSECSLFRGFTVYSSEKIECKICYLPLCFSRKPSKFLIRESVFDYPTN